MATIRGVKDRKTVEFVQLFNIMFEDKHLSLKAKGFIGYCLTKPPTWVFHVDYLCSVLKEGEKAIYAVIKECIRLGYAYRYQLRDDKGRTRESEIIVSDSKEEIQAMKSDIEHLQKLCQPVADFVETDEEYTTEGNSLLDEYEPLAGFRVADKRHLSNTDHTHTDLREQQQEKSAAVLLDKNFQEKKDSEKNKHRPMAYECFDHLVHLFPGMNNVTMRDKMEMTAKYDEDTVKYAIGWAQANKNKIEKGLVQTLKWACKVRPEMPKNAEDILNQNKQHAKKYAGLKSKGIEIETYANYVEFCCRSNQMQSKAIEYREKGFMDKFEQMLIKNGFSILTD